MTKEEFQKSNGGKGEQKDEATEIKKWVESVGTKKSQDSVPVSRPFSCGSEQYIVVYVADSREPSGFRTVLRKPEDHFQRTKLGVDGRLGAVERDYPMMFD